MERSWSTVRHECSRYWPITATSLAMYMVAAGTFSFMGTLTQSAVQHEFMVSVGDFSAVLGLVQMLRLPFMLLSGPIIDCLSPGVAVCIAQALMAILSFLMGSGFVTSICQYYLLRSALFTVSPLGDIPAHVCVQSSYFDAAQPLVIGIINAGYSLAGSWMPVTLALLVGACGWRSAWVVSGVLGVALTALGAVMVRRPGPLPVGTAVSRDPMSTKPLAGLRMGEAVRTRAFWALLISLACTLYWEGTITNHLLLVLQLDAHKSLSEASAYYSLQYAFAIVGKVSSGALMRLVPRRLFFLLGPLVFCLVHVLLLEPTTGASNAVLALPPALSHALAAVGASSIRVTTSSTRFRAFAVLYGLSFGLTHSMLTIQPAHLFGRVHLPYLQTIAKAVDVAGVSLGQIGSGWLYDATGSYAGPLLLTFGVSALNVVSCSVLACAPGVEERGATAARRPGALL